MIMDKPKLGRPFSDDPRNVRLTFASTKREEEFMRYAADLAGKKFSVFCREAVMDEAMRVYNSQKRES